MRVYIYNQHRNAHDYDAYDVGKSDHLGAKGYATSARIYSFTFAVPRSGSFASVDSVSLNLRYSHKIS